MRSLLLLTVLIVLLRVPFLQAPIQEDDIYYLAGAEHALVEPLHPLHTSYVLQGTRVSMRGHPHPPLNVWLLGGLWALCGQVQPLPFHLAYLALHLLLACSALALARRFAPSVAFSVALMTATVPALMVSAGTLEADLPFNAFWLTAIALFISAVDRRSPWRLALSSMALAIAAMGAYQAVLTAPILGFYLWQRRREWRWAWVAIFTAPLVLVAWQLFERATAGSLPASVLTGYFNTYALQQFANKWKNAVALTAHLPLLAAFITPLLAGPRRRTIWLVGLLAALAALALDPHPLFAIPFGLGVATLFAVAFEARSADRDRQFLAVWILLFFAAALIVFFAGAERYLLPLSFPLICLTMQSIARFRWRWVPVTVQIALGLLFAFSYQQQWERYRQIALDIAERAGRSRVWVDGEWGLRYYLEQRGALAAEHGKTARPGDYIVTSELAFPIGMASGGGVRMQVATYQVTPSIPMRLLAMHSRSAFQTIAFGLRPFDIGTAPADAVRLERIEARAATLSYVPMNAPQAEYQIDSGIYGLEQGGWRWTGSQAVVRVKSAPLAATAEVYLAPGFPLKRAMLSVDGQPVWGGQLHEGKQTLQAPFLPIAKTEALVSLTIGPVSHVNGDPRDLGVVLIGMGLR